MLECREVEANGRGRGTGSTVINLKPFTKRVNFDLPGPFEANWPTGSRPSSPPQLVRACPTSPRLDRVLPRAESTMLEKLHTYLPYLTLTFRFFLLCVCDQSHAEVCGIYRGYVQRTQGFQPCSPAIGDLCEAGSSVLCQIRETRILAPYLTHNYAL
jgi:hypothetical protein